MMKHIRKRRNSIQRFCPIRLTPFRKGVADRLLYDSASRALYHTTTQNASAGKVWGAFHFYFAKNSRYPLQIFADRV